LADESQEIYREKVSNIVKKIWESPKIFLK